MKKLLTILATVALIGGSVFNTIALNKQNLFPNNINKQKINVTQSNEDVEDIANKLFGKIINLDPNFWLNKDIHNYQSQFNDAIVKQKVLTADEAKYVTWNNLEIVRAGYFWSQADFTVAKDGATATGHVTVNATNGETSKQVAAKISKAKLNFNLNYWSNKTILSQFQIFRQMFVNEKILTKNEASLVSLASSSFKITQAGQFVVQLHVNDGNQDVVTPLHIAVVNDGLSAQQIASKTKGTYYLNGNMQGQYADSAQVYNNFRNMLINDNIFNYEAPDAYDIILPHVKLKSDNSIQATVLKDGQTATASFNLAAHNYAEILTQNETNTVFNVLVNLTPKVISNLKYYFGDHTQDDILGYFYQILDDGKFNDLPSCSNEFFKWNNRLEIYFGDYGNQMDSPSNIAGHESDAGDTGNQIFESVLASEINQAPSGAYLTCYFQWEYSYHYTWETYTTNGFAFW